MTWRILLASMVLIFTSVILRAEETEGKSTQNKQEPLPLIVPPERITGESLVVLGMGGNCELALAPWNTLMEFFVGAHEHIAVWDLRGILSTPQGRQLAGTSTLLASGLGTPCSPLVHLGVLKVGNDLGSWQLQNTNRFRNFPEPFLNPDAGFIRDRTSLARDPLEMTAYSEVLTMAQYTSHRAFLKHARDDLSYAHLFHNPQKYRGEVILGKGSLLLVRRHDPPREAADKGVHDLYEAWIYPKQPSDKVILYVFTVWPDGLPRKLLREGKIKPPARVRFAGYFFKRFRYEGRDKDRPKGREAPVIIGHSLTPLRIPSQVPKPEPPGNFRISELLTVFMVIVAGSILFIFVLIYWYRRGDSRIHRRLQPQQPEAFSPPPAFPPGASPPLARPISPGATESEEGKQGESRENG